MIESIALAVIIIMAVVLSLIAGTCGKNNK